MACIIFIGLPLISLSCSLKASMTLGCSENSISTWLVLSDWRVQFIKYFTSPAGVKKLMKSSGVIDGSGLTTNIDLRISSTLQLSKLLGNGGYGGKPCFSSCGSLVFITCSLPVPLTELTTFGGNLGSVGCKPGTTVPFLVISKA